MSVQLKRLGYQYQKVRGKLKVQRQDKYTGKCTTQQHETLYDYNICIPQKTGSKDQVHRHGKHPLLFVKHLPSSSCLIR